MVSKNEKLSPNSGYSNIDVENVPKPLDFEENTGDEDVSSNN